MFLVLNVNIMRNNTTTANDGATTPHRQSEHNCHVIMPIEEEAEGAVVVRAKKWDKAEKDKFKRLVKEGKLKWDGNAAHREEIRTKHWPGRNKETFRRNWNTSAAEFRVAEFKDGARARSVVKGEKVDSM